MERHALGLGFLSLRKAVHVHFLEVTNVYKKYMGPKQCLLDGGEFHYAVYSE